MRNLLVFLSLFLFQLQLVAQEQTESTRNFKGGLLLGAVTSQISGDGLGGWDKFGMTAGAWVRVPITERVSASMSMKYINKGSRTKLDTITFNRFGYYLNYIEVPVSFSYSPSKKYTDQFFINFGPYAGYLFKQKIISNGYDYEVNPPFDRLDIGLELGATFWMIPKFGVSVISTSSVLPTRPNPSQVNRLSYYEKGNYNQTLQLIISKGF